MTGTTARVIKVSGAGVCTGEYLTNGAMIGHSTIISGHYTRWKRNAKVITNVETLWDKFLESQSRNDTFLNLVTIDYFLRL